MRLFLDANILFTAAHNPQGKAALIIELGQAGLWQLASSSYACEEARRNIARKYAAALSRFEAQLSVIRVVSDLSDDLACPDGLAAKDWPIYRAAKACGADVLLTGDLRDFGFLMNAPEKTNGLLIQTVADFLNNLIAHPHSFG